MFTEQSFKLSFLQQKKSGHQRETIKNAIKTNKKHLQLAQSLKRDNCCCLLSFEAHNLSCTRLIKSLRFSVEVFMFLCYTRGSIPSHVSQLGCFFNNDKSFTASMRFLFMLSTELAQQQLMSRREHYHTTINQFLTLFNLFIIYLPWFLVHQIAGGKKIVVDFLLGKSKSMEVQSDKEKVFLYFCVSNKKKTNVILSFFFLLLTIL